MSSVGNFSVAATARADNNAALVYYEDYGIAKIAKYLAIAVGILGVLLFSAGLFGGRLIGL